MSAACQAEAPLSAGEVELDDFYIKPVSGTWEAGHVEFDVFNEGNVAHTLVLTTEDGSTVIASTEPIGSGESVVMAVDLLPGTYTLSCRIVKQASDGTFVDHFEEGMHTTIHVEET